jgi:hypothetical protein
MNAPIRPADRTTFLVQIDRRDGSLRAWHTPLPIEGSEVYAFDGCEITHATKSQFHDPSNILIKLNEDDLSAMGFGLDLYECNSSDRRLLLMFCSAIHAGLIPDITGLKRQLGLYDENATWDELNWHALRVALFGC